MLIKDYTLKLDIKRKILVSNIEFVALDSNTSVLNIQITKDLIPLNITNYNVRLNIKKPDGHLIIQDINNGVSIVDTLTGQIKIVLQDQSMAIKGTYSANVSIFDNDEKLTTQDFQYIVRQNYDNDQAVQSTGIIPLERSIEIAFNQEMDKIEFALANIPNGSNGAVINDNTSSNSTVYSSSKVDSKLSELASQIGTGIPGSGGTGTNDYNSLINKPTIPTTTSQLTNNSNFETTTGSQAKVDSAITAIKNGVSVDGDTLSKLRGLISGIQTLLGSNDVNLDTLQEIVTYIKDNKSVLDGVTTSKISVSDIINDLIHTDINKPMSANQGKTLKDLVDALTTVVSGKQASLGFTPVSTSSLDADVNMTANSDSKLATQKAIKAYVDAKAIAGGSSVTINDTTPSATSVYSSSKVQALVNGTNLIIFEDWLGGETVTIDTSINIVPVITSSYNTLSVYDNTSISIPYFISDVNGGTFTATYTKNGTPLTASLLSLGLNTWSIGTLTTGNHTLTIKVTDNTSLDSNVLSFNFAVSAHPTNTAPSITSSYNTTTVYTTDNINIPYTVTDTEGGSLTTTYNIDGVTSTTTISTGLNTWNVGTLADGSHTLTIQVKDSGNLNSNILTFNVTSTVISTNTALSISSTFTTTTALNTDNINIPYIIADSQGGTFVATYTKDGVVSNPTGLTTGSNTWNVGTLSAGNHTLSIQVSDNGSLDSNTLSFNLTVSVVMALVTDNLIFNAGIKTGTGTTLTDLTSRNIVTMQGFNNTSSSGFNNGTLVFDGSDDYLSINDGTDFNFGSGDFTIQFKIKRVSKAGINILIAKKDATESFMIYIDSSNRLFSRISNTATINPTNTLSNFGIYYDIALIRRGTSAELYLDQVLIGTSTISTSVNVNTANVLFGYDGSSTSWTFSGNLKSLLIYKGKALTIAELTQNSQTIG